MLRLDPESITGKFKFGQNMGGKKRDAVLTGLNGRGLSGDAETMEWIRAKAPVRPEHS